MSEPLFSSPPETPPQATQPLGSRGRAESLSALPHRLRRHVAALSLVGGVLVALPVMQLLRYQANELDALAAGRAILDPVARAVQVQRGLLAHSEITAQVLAGRALLEPDRRLRQAEVDARMATMVVALATGRWDLAIGEADELSQDWRNLTQQIGVRSVDARGSTQAHRLLIEQTLQVIDLVDIADQGERTHGANLTSPKNMLNSATSMTLHTQLLHTLPRLVWQTGQLSQTGWPSAALGTVDSAADGLEPWRKAQLIEASLARSLGQLERAAQGGAAGSVAQRASPDDTALLKVGAAAGAATAHLVAVLRQPSHAHSAADRQGAANAAVQAQMQFFDLAYGSTNAKLAAQHRQLSQRRALLMGGLGFLALLAAALLGRIWRGTLLWQDRERERQAAAPLAASWRVDASAQHPGQEPTERRLQTEQLMQRLREPGDSPVPPGEVSAQGAAQRPASPAPRDN